LLHILDDTRLPPDVYHRNTWTAKIATDALERAGDEAKNKEKAGIKALRDVMDNSGQQVERLFNATKEAWEDRYGPTFNIADWDPKINVPAESWKDKVEELDLDTFAEMIEGNGLGRWHSHLQMIKWEFRLPFSDPRKPMEPLTGDKLFKLITGETDQSLRPGKEITGKVVRNGDFGSRVKLEGDIPAFIPLRNLADEHVETAEDVVTIGMVVTALVTEVKKDHMCVDMSLKMEDFRRLPSSWDRPTTLTQLDEHFDRRASSSIEEHKTKEREARLERMHLRDSSHIIGGDGEDGATRKRMGRVARRACAHPAFRNAKNDEVDKELREAGAAMVGEAMIRPSSKSSDSLAIHWVVREGCVKVIEVIEDEKDTDASIGNILKIKVRNRCFSVSKASVRLDQLTRVRTRLTGRNIRQY
jgi:transcription elongation factor SPT6